MLPIEEIIRLHSFLSTTQKRISMKRPVDPMAPATGGQIMTTSQEPSSQWKILVMQTKLARKKVPTTEMQRKMLARPPWGLSFM